jgi:hypothetical protein
MPTIQQTEQIKDPERRKHETRNALVRQQVLNALGDPGDLLKVQVRLLWENHYRVNILVGTDITTARVAHSYFLVADDNGTIVASTPTITKRY